MTAPTAVPRPAPRSSSPHTFEVTQLLRRFPTTHRRVRSDDAEILTLAIPPSDPDFIYPLDALRCELIIPASYKRPAATRTILSVLNADIPAGCKRRIEAWWRDDRPAGTLLDATKRLDRELERLLGEGARDAEPVVVEMRYRAAQKARSPSPPPPREPTPPPPPRAPSPPRWTQEQRAEAARRRERDVRQLRARMARDPAFAELGETCFRVPVVALKRGLLPVPLQPLTSVRLVVPMEYNLVPPRIEMAGVPRALAEAVEACWASYVAANPAVGLTAAVNMLGAKLHVWATDAGREAEREREAREQEERAKARAEEAVEQPADAPPPDGTVDAEKPHVHVIPRPPEWSLPPAEDSDTAPSDSDSDAEPADDDPAADSALSHPGAAHAPEHGTALSIPSVSLSNIDLLELSDISLTVRCTRCKSPHDVTHLKPTPPGSRPAPRIWRCTKCQTILGAGFRKDLVHAASPRLGFFDLTNCTIDQLLPCDFRPQCASCDSTAPQPDLRAVAPNAPALAHCRNCHRKMALRFPEFRLLRITPAGEGAGLDAPRARRDAARRFVAGSPLPDRGRCVHYRRSTRWFRFACCAKLYPCDRCHDEAEAHPLEQAARMVCGLCSREQVYRPEDCRFCGNCFVRRATGRFWEGGKGTRDQRLMSRNDPRKHKRIGGKKET